MLRAAEVVDRELRALSADDRALFTRTYVDGAMFAVLLLFDDEFDTVQVESAGHRDDLGDYTESVAAEFTAWRRPDEELPPSRSRWRWWG
jgi:hypothetical protein